MILFSVRKLISLFLDVYYLKRILKIQLWKNLETNLTFENLESDNTAFPLHLTIMNSNIRQEKLWIKYGSSTKQHRIMKNLDWMCLGPTLSRVMSRQVLNISQAGDSTASVGNLFQHLTTLGVNLSFLYPIVNSPEPVSTDFHTLAFSKTNLFHLYS